MFFNTINFSILYKIITISHPHYLSTSFETYRKYKWLIKLFLMFNKNYIPCEILREKYKFNKNIAVFGLRYYGKNVKRNVSGYAKSIIQDKEINCIYCDVKLTNENASTDHIVPVSNKGSNCQLNLLVCCNDCNSDRGNIDFYEYLKMRNEKYTNMKYIFV